MQVRPTSDRLRETLFNVIAPRIQEARFLDLCAGSGAIGIEAVSREAAHVTFIDRSRKMCSLIQSNLELLQIAHTNFRIVQSEAADFVTRSAKRNLEPWDIIFFDPPYDDDYLPVLESLGSQPGNLLTAEGLLVVEHHKKKALSDQIGVLHRNRILKQGDSALSFYEIGSRASRPQ